MMIPMNCITSGWGRTIVYTVVKETLEVKVEVKTLTGGNTKSIIIHPCQWGYL